MPIIDMDKVAGSKIAKPFERELRVVMSPETHHEVEGFTLMMSILAPDGGCTDFHAHESSGELMIILGGKGKALVEGVEHELRPGVAFYAPPGMVHKTVNPGSEPLRIACVFVPPVDTTYIRDNQKAAENAK
jgi:mannose-6-phosphate isomerase-like protein (cupin superfamily)